MQLRITGLTVQAIKVFVVFNMICLSDLFCCEHVFCWSHVGRFIFLHVFNMISGLFCCEYVFVGPILCILRF